MWIQAVESESGAITTKTSEPSAIYSEHRHNLPTPHLPAGPIFPRNLTSSYKEGRLGGIERSHAGPSSLRPFKGRSSKPGLLIPCGPLSHSLPFLDSSSLLCSARHPHLSPGCLPRGSLEHVTSTSVCTAVKCRHPHPDKDFSGDP